MSIIITIILLFKRIYMIIYNYRLSPLTPHKIRFGILVKFWWNSIVSNASPPWSRILETDKKWRMKVLVTENSTCRLCHTPSFPTYTHPQIHKIGFGNWKIFFNLLFGIFHEKLTFFSGLSPPTFNFASDAFALAGLR